MSSGKTGGQHPQSGETMSHLMNVRGFLPLAMAALALGACND
jgi:hypothetical protein